MWPSSKWRESVQNELFIQLKTSIPASLSSIVYKIPWLISVAFVGRIGANELAAAALATSLCNVTGLSLSLGLSSAVTTLTGQSKGEMQRRRKLARQKESKKFVKRTTENQEEKKMDSEEDTTSLKHKSNYGSTNAEEIDLESGYDMNGTSYPMTPKTYLYRGLFIQLMFVLPVGIYWIFGIKTLLIALGQEETIAEMASVSDFYV